LNELPEMSLGKLPVVFRLGEGALLPAAIPLPVAGFAVAVVVAPFGRWLRKPPRSGATARQKQEVDGGIAPRLFQQIGAWAWLWDRWGGSTKVDRGSSRFGVLGAMPPDYDRFPE
jgi:hypothetical protein